MFHEGDVVVHVVSVCSLYVNVIGGLAGTASLLEATSDTIPLTTSPSAGLSKVIDGGVLSTRVVIAAEVVALPAASAATVRRS